MMQETHLRQASESPPISSKMDNWKGEISFWKQEIKSLHRLTVYGVVGCALEERPSLRAIQQELITFENEQIPVVEHAVSTLDKNAQNNQYYSVEEIVEQTRRAYMAIKTRLLPFFPKVISVHL